MGDQQQQQEQKQASRQESEAVQLMRAALENPRGTALERRQKLLKAWTFLRQSAALNPNNAEGVLTLKEGKKRLKGLTKDRRRVKKQKVDAERDGQQRSAVNKEEGEELLYEAARLGAVEQVVKLLKEGVHISCQDNQGYSALHWASLYGHVHVVRALLGAGAGDGKRINRKTNSGNTPLHFACTGQHSGIAALLQLYKPDIYAANEYGQTPVSLGFRTLVAGVEEEHRLAQVQALRNQSRLLPLIHETEFERQVNEGDQNAHGNNGSGQGINSNWQNWEAYQIAWNNFLQTYGDRDVAISSNGPGLIEFQDIPWPLLERRGSQDGEELLLSLLHVSGRDLRMLIQQERLRWHPDKFLQVFDSRLAAQHRDAILLGVKTVSQLLNSLASE